MKKMFGLMSLLAVVSLILMACGAPATPHPLALTPVSTIAAPVDAHVTPTRSPATDAHITDDCRDNGTYVIVSITLREGDTWGEVVAEIHGVCAANLILKDELPYYRVKVTTSQGEEVVLFHNPFLLAGKTEDRFHAVFTTIQTLELWHSERNAEVTLLSKVAEEGKAVYTFRVDY